MKPAISHLLHLMAHPFNSQNSALTSRLCAERSRSPCSFIMGLWRYSEIKKSHRTIPVIFPLPIFSSLPLTCKHHVLWIMFDSWFVFQLSAFSFVVYFTDEIIITFQKFSSQVRRRFILHHVSSRGQNQNSRQLSKLLPSQWCDGRRGSRFSTRSNGGCISFTHLHSQDSGASS